MRFVAGCVQRKAASQPGNQWAEEAMAAMKKASPTSLRITHRSVSMQQCDAAAFCPARLLGWLQVCSRVVPL